MLCIAAGAVRNKILGGTPTGLAQIDTVIPAVFFLQGIEKVFSFKQKVYNLGIGIWRFAHAQVSRTRREGVPLHKLLGFHPGQR